MLEGQTAIITGAAQGIGKGIAEMFAQNGANLVIADISEKNIKIAAESIKKNFGIQVLPLIVNVASQESVQEMVAKAAKTFGKIDILVNNAGISRPGILFEDIPIKDWTDTWEINVMGVVHGMQAVIPVMKKQKNGRIINMSSLASLRGSTTISACYGASKAAINSMTRAAANWLGEFNITVNGIAPGFIDTKMTDGSALDASTVPLGKVYGTVYDVADTALFLASAHAKYITGTLIDVNGGVFMR